jgi:hypothetical protein
MRYMMLMNAPGGSGGYKVNEWAQEDFKAHMAFMHDFNRHLVESGEFVDAQGLAPPSQAKLVRAGANGMPVTDGPFAETKEFLAGFWILDVVSAERACELAAQVSVAPGPRGQPLNMSIELRQILSAPPTDA